MLDLAVTPDPELALLIYVVLVVAAVLTILGMARLLREKRTPLAGFGIYESAAPADRVMTNPVLLLRSC